MNHEPVKSAIVSGAQACAQPMAVMVQLECANCAYGAVVAPRRLEDLTSLAKGELVDVRRDSLAEKASHGVLRPVTSGVGAEHHPQHGQALPLPALAEQELGGLRQEEEADRDQQTWES